MPSCCASLAVLICVYLRAALASRVPFRAVELVVSVVHLVVQPRVSPSTKPELQPVRQLPVEWNHTKVSLADHQRQANPSAGRAREVPVLGEL